MLTLCEKEPFACNEDGVLFEVVALKIDTAVALLLLSLIESNFMRRVILHLFVRKSQCKPESEPLDADVLEERKRVEEVVLSNSFTDSLTVNMLSKRFGSRAVNRLSFGVHQKECFGLLGINGAGKTTTFKMLTGDIIADGGNAYMNPNCHLEKNLSTYNPCSAIVLNSIRSSTSLPERRCSILWVAFVVSTAAV